MVALLFRTLDAFRIYDAVFIITRGANDTETVSVLGYEQLVNRLNLGLGSAVAILIFISRDADRDHLLQVPGRQPAEQEVTDHDRINLSGTRSCGPSGPSWSCSTP